MTHDLTHRLWTHNHGIKLTPSRTLHVWRLDTQPLTNKVRQWIKQHREQLITELEPHPDKCWNCPPDNSDYVDRYDSLGRPWCHTCWALHLLNKAGLLDHPPNPPHYTST